MDAKELAVKVDQEFKDVNDKFGVCVGRFVADLKNEFKEEKEFAKDVLETEDKFCEFVARRIDYKWNPGGPIATAIDKSNLDYSGILGFVKYLNKQWGIYDELVKIIQ